MALRWLFRTIAPFLLASSGFAYEVPAGATLDVRLKQSIASYSSKKGTPVDAVLISPVCVDGKVVLPIGTKIRGSLAKVNRVGWGIVRGRANLTLDFNRIELRDGSTFDMKTRLVGIENARESVTEKGEIVGIRATDAFGHKMAGIARTIFFWDPMIQVVLAGSTMAVLRFPESEIHFPAGTDMTLQLAEPVAIGETFEAPLPRIALSPAHQEILSSLVRGMQYRSVDAKSGKPADIVNVVFLGEPEWVQRALSASGWVKADRLTMKTGWKTFASFAQSSQYREAPMSAQTFEERRPISEYSKTLNTYSKRHHMRVFEMSATYNGKPVLAVASTQDLGIDFNFKKIKFTHYIDRNIDNERAKIVNDLLYTGCVDAADIFERTWIARDAKNTAGQQLVTDGAVVALEMNPCRNPARVDSEDHPPVRISGSAFQKIPRQFFLTIRNDFSRNNPAVQAGYGMRYLWRKMTGHSAPPQPERSAEILSAMP